MAYLVHMHHRFEMAKRNRPVHIHRGDDAVESAGSVKTVECYTSMLKNSDEIQLRRKIYAETTILKLVSFLFISAF